MKKFTVSTGQSGKLMLELAHIGLESAGTLGPAGALADIVNIAIEANWKMVALSIAAVGVGAVALRTMDLWLPFLKRQVKKIKGIFI